MVFLKPISHLSLDASCCFNGLEFIFSTCLIHTILFVVFHYIFQQLYRKKPGMTMNAARLENNIPKNRYRDISPCKYHSVTIDLARF